MEKKHERTEPLFLHLFTCDAFLRLLLFIISDLRKILCPIRASRENEKCPIRATFCPIRASRFGVNRPNFAIVKQRKSMTAFKNKKHPRKSSQERQAAAQRFLEDRLACLETIRDMINSELDRRNEEFTSQTEEEHKKTPSKRCKWCKWLDKLRG